MSRWTTGLLICLVILNAHFVFMALEQKWRQKGLTLDVQEHRVKILRDNKGEPVKIAAELPPSAFEYEWGVPAYAYYGVASLVFGGAALFLHLRTKPLAV